MIVQGDIFLFDFGEPDGSKPAKQRPVIIVQCDPINASALNTVVVVPLTSNLKHADDAGNLLLRAADTDLSMDSVAIGPQITVINKEDLGRWVARLDARLLDAVLNTVEAVLGR